MRNCGGEKSGVVQRGVARVRVVFLCAKSERTRLGDNKSGNSPNAYGSGIIWSVSLAGKSYMFQSGSSEIERRPRMSKAAETSNGDLQRVSIVCVI